MVRIRGGILHVDMVVEGLCRGFMWVKGIGLVRKVSCERATQTRLC